MRRCGHIHFLSGRYAAGEKVFISFLITVRISGQLFLYDGAVRTETPTDERRYGMKGYYNSIGYMGYVEGRWVLFACEQDYFEYMEE